MGVRERESDGACGTLSRHARTRRRPFRRVTVGLSELGDKNGLESNQAQLLKLCWLAQSKYTSLASFAGWRNEVEDGEVHGTGDHQLRGPVTEGGG